MVGFNHLEHVAFGVQWLISRFYDDAVGERDS